jgi:hypothetical protein
LRLQETAKAFDSASAGFGRLVPQVLLQRKAGPISIRKDLGEKDEFKNAR